MQENEQKTCLPLTPEEINDLQTKVGKSHHNQKDWDYIGEVLKDKIVYTALPTSLRMKKKYSMEGVLMHGGALLVFSSMESCQHYLMRIGMGTGEKYMMFKEVVFDRVREIASEKKRMAYLDLSQPVASKIIGIDGRDGSLKIFTMKQ